MPGENIPDWSVVAANNGTSDSLISWPEGMPRASVNDSARSMMAAIAKDRDLKNGSIVTTGTANAQAFSSGVSYTAVPTGLWVRLKVGAGLTNTAAVTLNMDGIGAVPIINATIGALQENAYVELLYDGTNWLLIGGSFRPAITTQVFTSGSGTYTTSAGATAIYVRLVGGGGGGGGSQSPGTGGNGGATTFGSLTGAGGGGGAANGGGGGVGGNASGGDVNIGGGGGAEGMSQGVIAGSPVQVTGGNGAASAFGGGGGGGASGGSPGGSGTANSGGGGGGGTDVSTFGGCGGGAGGYVEKLFVPPDATYAYAVGAGGAQGIGPSQAGGAGGAGVIIVQEYY